MKPADGVRPSYRFGKAERIAANIAQARKLSSEAKWSTCWIAISWLRKAGMIPMHYVVKLNTGKNAEIGEGS